MKRKFSIIHVPRKGTGTDTYNIRVDYEESPPGQIISRHIFLGGAVAAMNDLVKRYPDTYEIPLSTQIEILKIKEKPDNEKK